MDEENPNQPVEGKGCLIGVAAVLLIIGLGAWTCAATAIAHEATDVSGKSKGWDYPLSCCSGYDCRGIATSEANATERVFETALGYRFSTSDELISYGDKRIRNSPDGEFHWCTVGGKPDGKTICLFVPPRGF